MKKTLLLLFAVLLSLFAIISLSGCDIFDDTKNDDKKYAAYKAYVEYTNETGEKPLSYEEWLKTIKGEDGKTPTVTIDDDGYWVINGEKTNVSARGEIGQSGRSVLKIEVVDGNVMVTYSDAPDTPVNVGKANYSLVVSDLDFYPLPDGSYAVGAGRTLYLEDIVIPAEHNGKPVTG